MSFKISPHLPPAHRKALKDFLQNPYVAAKVVVGDFDHLVPAEIRKELEKAREADPVLVQAAKDRIERGIRAGKVRP